MAYVKSFGVAPGANSSLVVITAPPAIAIGNLIMAGICFDSNVETIADPDGTWTQLLSFQSADPLQMEVWYKIANSADAAASSFTFTGDPTPVSNHGGMVCVADFDHDNPIDASVISGTTPANLVCSISSLTPTRPGCLMLMFVSSDDNFTTSGYQIATDNPLWTEQFDVNTTAGADCCIACASAQRPQKSATGTGQATFAINGNPGAKRDIGALITISPLLKSYQKNTLRPAPFKPMASLR